MTDDLARAVGEVLGDTVAELREVPGGDINLSFRVTIGDGTPVFVKTRPDPPVGFYESEAAGLRWLAEAAAVPVPEVLAVSEASGAPAFLALA